LESDSISKWLSWIGDALLINVPRLAETVVAVPEGNVSVVDVSSAINIEALSAVVLDVSVSSSNPSDPLVVLVSVLSDGSSDTNSESISSLVSDDIVSSGPGSDSLGSIIEGPPLSLLVWVVVSDSKSVLVSTNMLVPAEGSVGWHS